MANDRAQPTRFLVVAIAVSLLAFWAEPLVAATTTYTGVYAGGTITPGNTVVLNNGSTVAGNVVANGTLQFNQTGSLTLSSTLSGTGTLSMTNTGTLNLTGTMSGTSTPTAVVLDMTTSAAAGLLQIRSGTGHLRIGNSGTGTLNVTGGSVTNFSGYLGYEAGSVGTATVSSGTWANSGDLTVGLNGAGTLTMSGGLVSVSGTLSTGTYGTINLTAGGTLQIGVGGTTGVLLGGTGSLVNNGTLIFNRSNASTYSGVLSGSGAVNKQGGGTLTLSGNSTFTGGTLIGRGALVVGNVNALGSAGSVTINSGTLNINGKSLNMGVLNGYFGATITSGTAGAVRLTSTAANNSTYAGVIANGSGTISFTKAGVGTLTLAGPNTLTGPTTIQQGSLQLAHASALSMSTISPLASGTLSLTPGLKTTIGGLSTNAGGLVDVGTGMVTVARGLSVSDLATALQSGRGDGWWNGSSGITSSAAASLNGTRTVGWLENDNGSVMFGYAATGDTNLDWVIDILDVANFVGSGKFNSGLAATWAEGDFNYDGLVDILDMADFVSTGLFNAAPYNTPAGTIAAVPEPSTLGVFGVGAGVVGLMAMRRKRAG